MTKSIYSTKTFHIFIFLLGFLSNYFAQQAERPNSLFKSPILLEKNTLFSDSSSICYISYRLPISNLIFIKNKNEYTGGLTLNIDIKFNNKIIDRKTSSKVVVVDSYEKTKSETDYIEGLIKIDDLKRDVVIQPYISITNSDFNSTIDSIQILQNSIQKEKFGKPVIVQKKFSNCSDSSDFHLVNFNNSIPYSPENIFLLIPVIDKSINELNIEVKQKGKEIIKQKVSAIINDFYNIRECDNSIILYNQKPLSEIKYFLISDFSYLLDEGIANFSIMVNGGHPIEFEIPVLWYNKPKTLMNAEFAIQLLQIIDMEEKVDSLLSVDKEEYLRILNNYWKEKSSKKRIAFNELMYEFYKRADYAMENYSTLGNQLGAKSDRGKTYIRYGKPDEIKREYPSSNIVKEIWKYINLKKEFAFSDKTGLGNYTLD